jgi:sulfur carrier protein
LGTDPGEETVMPITVTVNGKNEQVEDHTSLDHYISGKNLDPKTVVVELNMDIIPQDKLSETILQDNDTLEILRFVGGG